MQDLSRSTDQRREHALDDADYTVPTRQHERDHTDQESTFPEILETLGGDR